MKPLILIVLLVCATAVAVDTNALRLNERDALNDDLPPGQLGPWKIRAEDVMTNGMATNSFSVTTNSINWWPTNATSFLTNDYITNISFTIPMPLLEEYVTLKAFLLRFRIMMAAIALQSIVIIWAVRRGSK